MYLLSNLGQVFLFKFRVTFWHFFIFSVRLYVVLRRRQPTFSSIYCSQTVVSILLPQPTTVDSTDTLAHMFVCFFYKHGLSSTELLLFNRRHVVTVEYLPNALMLVVGRLCLC